MTKQELLDYLKIKPKSFKRLGSVSILDTNDKKYVLKENKNKSNYYDYLNSRNFNNFPTVYSSVDDDVELTDYIHDRDIPIEQKLEDLIYLTSILHNKTTFYKTVDEDYIKTIYETTIDKQDRMFKYYNELQDMIEMEVYMSPANYLLIRNISMFYYAIRKSREYLDMWYSIVKEEHKVRYVYIHGNLDKKHLIEDDNLYLISWDKSRIDLPIYDLEKFYKNSYYDISLSEIFEIYELKYPLKKEEKYLLLAFLLIPDSINFNKSEYERTKIVTNYVYFFNKTLEYLKNDSKKANYNK